MSGCVCVGMGGGAVKRSVNVLLRQPRQQSSSCTSLSWSIVVHNLAASQCSVRSDPRVGLVHLTQHALPEISASNALSLIAWVLEKITSVL